MVPLCQGVAYLTYLHLFPLPPTTHPQKPQHHQHRHAALAGMDTTLRGHIAVSFDTDGIPFIVNNSATCIIANKRTFFIGNLVPVQVQVNTNEATQVRGRYEGTICQELVNDDNVKQTYDIPGAI